MTDIQIEPTTTGITSPTLPTRIYTADFGVVRSTSVPVISWASPLEDGARQQIVNVSRLPFAIDHVALMPDAHQGYGMPVGGVLFAAGAVVPYAIGVDIGCGVALIETDLMRSDLKSVQNVGNGKTLVERFLAEVARTVPVGNGPQAQHATVQGDLYAWLPEGTIGNTSITPVAERAFEAAATQLGTLGGGNHFLELQVEDTRARSTTGDPYDADDGAGGQVFFMIHSGSRSLGKKICDHHAKVALELNRKWHSALPDKELAYLPVGTPEFDAYWADMTFALAWAEENRRRMAAAVINAFGRIFGLSEGNDEIRLALDVHHNYAAWENHRTAHGDKNGIVHRKGAVRARVGDTVLIPGSMGTASYIAEGLGNPASFETCQHGAGRARSRGATRKITTLADLDSQLGNVILVTPKRDAVIDESPAAYKDIETVMAASRDLVTPTKRLLPIGVVKG